MLFTMFSTILSKLKLMGLLNLSKEPDEGNEGEASQ